ncbi:hypothetical protein DL93DRAFT_2060501 [Clavulina sp. PMI_390]|nr:hypothetical protein DL93DRAFT_2060501 [Clavulina sp. PMI_390]
MAPFTAVSVLTGLKERIEAILLQGDTLFVGTSTGALSTYIIERDEDNFTATPLETRSNFTKRAIEQLDYIRDVNSLISLSDGIVTLSPLPNLSPQTPLTQARNAMSFTVHVSVQSPESTAEDSSSTPNPPGVMTVFTQLAIGCRKKLVLYSWKNGEPQEVREINLPHSPRAVAFCNPQMLVMAYTATDHAIAYLSTMSIAELSLPTNTAISSSTSAGSMGKALTGFGGYVAGLAGKVQKPTAIQVSDGEVIVTKEMSSFFIGPEGKLSRSIGISWGAIPDDSVFVKPYVLSILPGSSTILAAARAATPASTTQPRIQVRSTLSLSNVQTLAHPFPAPTPTTAPTATATEDNVLMRVLTASPNSRSPAFVLTTPTDKASAMQGSTIWMLNMQSWAAQLDELVDAEKYEEALMLLDIIDPASLEDKPRRYAFIRSLYAMDLFAKGSYDEAINIFLELNVNPAKVVALYPEVVSGRLFVPREDWIPLFGGPERNPANGETPGSVTVTTTGATQEGSRNEPEAEEGGLVAAESTVSMSGASGDDRASLASTRPQPAPASSKQAVETLLRYLSDRRPQLSGSLATLGITPSQAHLHPSLSSHPVPEILALPDGISIGSAQLVPEQLLQFAQIVDTALFKSYLVVRPGLVGSLCRLDNWCEVEEVEEELRKRQKFNDLIDLYRGKKMHEKAMKLIHELSLDEDDLLDKLGPAIRYLQKLGTEYLDLIFRSARWVIDVDAKMGLQIFTAEDAQLPRDQVSDFLMKISPALCAGYMEYLIDETGEANTVFHDRLAELYLRAAQDGRATAEDRDAAQKKLLHFIRTSEFYNPTRLFGRLPNNSLFEARALLLGKLDRHEAALEIYVYRLHDYDEAEEYCKVVLQKNPESEIFLSLLQIYLRPNLESEHAQASRPTSPSSAVSDPDSPSHSLLTPALDLIARHSAHMNSSAVLDLLPPLVPAASLHKFLVDALDPRGKTGRVIREVWKARKVEVDSRLVALRARKVRVIDARICPQCHKRIGNNVIAVHSPRGEVTHYGCREAFAAQKQVLDAGRR